MYKWDVGHVLRSRHAYAKSIISLVDDDIIRLVANRVQFYFYDCDSNDVFKHKLKDRHDSSSIYDSMI